MRKSDYQPLGKYIEQVNVRNRDLTVTNLMGVSIEKRFIPSIANTIGTDLSPYKIVKPGQFAYGPVTSRNGDKITIALYNGNEDCIISQAYEAFRIKDTTQLLPEYLMMWAKRPEFDRYARYMSHGSVRELFSWEEMCNVMLPVPPIEEQHRIVSEYQTVERRIANNEALIQKLEETAQAIYYHTFVEGIDEENLPEGWRKGTIEELCCVKDGTHDSPKTCKCGYPLITSAHLEPYSLLLGQAYNISTDDFNKINERSLVEEKDILYSMIGTIGSIHYAINKRKDYAIKNMALFKTSKCLDYAEFILCTLKSLKTENYIKASVSGSTQNYVTLNILRGIPITIPDIEAINRYHDKSKYLFYYIGLLASENSHLRTLLSLLTSKLS
ncbi:restriction endonuclease subunit S [Leyella stercorea]|uniref:restriction endonuclease subunit S n=1 Tax=Leyella stercorea TaxID=363265 RepID=UPI002FE31BDF